VPEFRLLGPVEVRSRAGPVDGGPPQQRVVLAVLLVDAGRPVRVETLIDRVWEERPPAGARRALHAHISRIRHMLRKADAGGQSTPGAATVDVVRRSGSYEVTADADLVDWHRFRRLLDAAGTRSASDAERASLLRDALRLWRGTPLADLPGTWAARTREAWLQQRLDAAVTWAEAELRLGRHGEVIGSVRDLLTEYPLAEPLVAALLRALAAAGRGAEALDYYATVRVRLAAELGSEPGVELRELHRAILRGEGGPGHGEPPGPLKPRHRVPAQLPPDVRGFAGRADELARLDAILAAVGTEPTAVVVSAVSGTAGVGKTALAVYWAHRAAGRFPDGQLYVNLRGFDPGGRVTAVRDAVRGFLIALEVPPERIPADVDAQVGLYRSVVAGRRVLVVLDNARDADQVRPLLPGTATALVLVTSRTHLTSLIATENAHSLTLPVLAVEEARELLARRLGAGRVDAEPEAVNTVIAACACLPLALAVAAARAQETGFPLAALAAELGDAARRLDVLDAGDAVSQVRAVLSWSYTALTPPAARLFRLLGAYAGPDISAAAAASLVGQPLPPAQSALDELVRASLLTAHAPGRYTFHDLLRAYAADLAAATDRDDARRTALARLLDHYLHGALAADRLIKPVRHPMAIPLGPPEPGVTADAPTTDSASALARLSTEQGALLAAVRRAVDNGFDRHVWQFAWALDTFLDRQGNWHARAATWEHALEAARRLADPMAEAAAHRNLANTDNQLGRHAEARDHLMRALDAYVYAGDPAGQAVTHVNLAHSYDQEGAVERALDHARQALAVSEAAGDRRSTALTANAVGWYLGLLGDHPAALEHCRRALALIQEIGDRNGEAAIWDSVGYAHHHLGQHTEAVGCYERAVTLYREIGDRYFEADTLGHLGETHLAAGRAAQARDCWHRSLKILTDLDHPDAAGVRAKLDAVE
jgi:DNA-binding SARP family transcriptional activator/tetratricopeptide (TPR) repeat protein